MLKVLACQQNHIICVKQRWDPVLPKSDTLLSPTALWCSVHYHYKQDQRDSTGGVQPTLRMSLTLCQESEHSSYFGCTGTGLPKWQPRHSILPEYPTQNASRNMLIHFMHSYSRYTKMETYVYYKLQSFPLTCFRSSSSHVCLLELTSKVRKEKIKTTYFQF